MGVSVDTGVSEGVNQGGDLDGPASSTDNAVARFDGATGKLLQNSVVIVDDSGNTSGVGTLAAGNISVSSSTIPANGMYLSGANSIGFSTNSTARVFIPSTGRLLVGTSSSTTVSGGDQPGIQAAATNTAAGYSAIRASADAVGSSLHLAKTRGSNGTFTVVNSGDTLGYIVFDGADGTNYESAAQIHAVVDGTPGNNDMPGALVFSTTPDGSATLSERLRITSDGRIFGTALHNNAGAVTGAVNQYIASGTYTPTLTNVANVAASTAYACQWMRVGNVVSVSGKVDIDPTLAATSTQLGISLPIASDITAAEGCSGTAFASGVAGQGAAIVGDSTNDRAQMQWVSSDITNQPMYFSFQYLIA